MTDEQINDFLGEEIPHLSIDQAGEDPSGAPMPPVNLPQKSTLSWMAPVQVQDRFDGTWTPDRIEEAQKGLSQSMGASNIIPPTVNEQQGRLDLWWRDTGQHIPRHVLDQMGIVGGEKIPTIKEVSDLEAIQSVNIVKDFLGIERPASGDPLADQVEPFMFFEQAGAEPSSEFVEEEPKPELLDTLKVADIEDLKTIRETINRRPGDFDFATDRAVKDEIEIRETMPQVIEAVENFPLATLVGTDFFNSLAFNLPEFTSRKGFSPTEALLGIPKGTESIWIRAVARIREQVVAQDPTLLARIGGDAGSTMASLIQFAALPDPSKAAAFARLSPAVKGAIGVGSRSGFLAAIQAPEEGETVPKRLLDVGKATGIGALVGFTFGQITEFIKNVPFQKRAAVLAEKFPQTTKADWVEALRLEKEGKLISVAVKGRTGVERALPKITPKGHRSGFAEIGKPVDIAKKTLKKVVESPRTKEAAIIKAAETAFRVKTQPSKAVKPVKVITKIEALSLKEIGAVGEGEKLRIVANPQLKKAIQADENAIAKLKTRRDILKAEKKLAVTKAKAKGAASKEIALAKQKTQALTKLEKTIAAKDATLLSTKEKAGIKLEKTRQGFKDKIEKIDKAFEFKQELRDDAISMITAIPRGMRPDFIKRAGKIGTKSQKPETALKKIKKLNEEIKVGIDKFDRKVAIKGLDKVISDINSKIDELPSPQKEQLKETIDSISTKKITKEPDAVGPEFDTADLDVKARRGRVQLLGDDLESLQATVKKLAGPLAGELSALNPDVEDALRLPDNRVDALNVIAKKNAHLIDVEDVEFIADSLKETFHAAKTKKKLLLKKGEKPVKDVLDIAPTEISESLGAKRKAKKIAKGKDIETDRGKLESAIRGIDKFARLDEMQLATLVDLMTTADAKAVPLILDILPHKGQREGAETFNAWLKVSRKEFGNDGFTDLDQILGEHTITVAGTKKVKVTLSELMSLEMDTRSPDNLLQRLNSDAMVIGSGEFVYPKDAEGNDIVDRLSEIKDAVQIVRDNKLAMALLDFTERMTPVQKAHADEVFNLLKGHPIKTRENYYPRSRKGDLRVSGPKGKVSVPPDKAGRYQPAPGGTLPMHLRPWHEVFLEGLETDAALSMAPALRNASVLLNDPAFKASIKANGREQELAQIIEILSNAQNLSTSKDIVDVYGGKLIKARTTSALGHRISTRLVQSTSFYAAQAITGTQGTILIKSYSRAEYDFIAEDSAIIDLRRQGRRIGVEVGTNASEEAFNLLFFGKTKGIANMGMKGLSKGDMNATSNIYYQLVVPEILNTTRTGKNIDPFKWEGQTETVGDLPTMKEGSPEFRYAAARRLEFVVRNSQPMFDMLDRSIALASTNLFRRGVFNMFRTAMNGMQNTAMRSTIDFNKGKIGKVEYANQLASVAEAFAAATAVKKGLKYALSTAATAILAGFGIFQFTDKKEADEVVTELAKDTAKSIAGANPLTRALWTVGEGAVDVVLGENYNFGRDPVEDPITNIINEAVGAFKDDVEAASDLANLSEMVIDPKTRKDKDFNQTLLQKAIDSSADAIKATWNVGVVITGAPLLAPGQELVSPFFRTSKIPIIREVTFGDVEDPQLFSREVHDLFERRKELTKESKKRRLSRDEDRALDLLDSFANSMNDSAKGLKQIGEHRKRKLRFKLLEKRTALTKKRLEKLGAK
jgi:hypothetical protein